MGSEMCIRDSDGTDGADAAVAGGDDDNGTDGAVQPTTEVEGISVDNDDDDAAAAATTTTTVAVAAATATTTAGAAAATGQLAITGSYNAISFALIAFGLLLIGMSFVVASDKQRVLFARAS